VVFCGSVAMADPMLGDVPPRPPEQAPHGVSLEIGPSLGRVEPVTGTVLTTEGVHFAPHVSINRICYFGGELDLARLSGDGPAEPESTMTSASNFPMQPSLGTIVPLAGTAATVEGVVGARAFAGMF